MGNSGSDAIWVMTLSGLPVLRGLHSPNFSPTLHHYLSGDGLGLDSKGLVKN